MLKENSLKVMRISLAVLSFNKPKYYLQASIGEVYATQNRFVTKKHTFIMECQESGLFIEQFYISYTSKAKKICQNLSAGAKVTTVYVQKVVKRLFYFFTHNYKSKKMQALYLTIWKHEIISHQTELFVIYSKVILSFIKIHLSYDLSRLGNINRKPSVTAQLYFTKTKRKNKCLWTPLTGIYKINKLKSKNSE